MAAAAAFSPVEEAKKLKLLAVVSMDNTWCECEGGSDGPGELSYALWGHGGRARRPPDGPDGLGARDAKSPGEERG